MLVKDIKIGDKFFNPIYNYLGNRNELVEVVEIIDESERNKTSIVDNDLKGYLCDYTIRGIGLTTKREYNYGFYKSSNVDKDLVFVKDDKERHDYLLACEKASLMAQYKELCNKMKLCIIRHKNHVNDNDLNDLETIIKTTSI